MKLKVQSGFTAIEILVVVIIGVLIATTFIGSLSNFLTAQVVRNTTEDVLGLIQEARTKTIASENSSQYGIHFQSDKAVLFVGSTYTAGASTNKEIVFDTRVYASSISLQGGGSDLLFNRLTGDTGTYGTIVIRLVSSTTGQKTITISQTGVSSSS